MFTSGQACETAPAVTRRGICDYNWRDGVQAEVLGPRLHRASATPTVWDDSLAGSETAVRSSESLAYVQSRVNINGRLNGFVRTRSASLR
jgi:hypothetical protein